MSDHDERVNRIRQIAEAHQFHVPSLDVQWLLDQLAVAERHLTHLQQERDQARLDVHRMATTKVGEKCDHHRSPLEALEYVALRECPICWKECAEEAQQQVGELARHLTEARSALSIALTRRDQLAAGLLEAENKLVYVAASARAGSVLRHQQMREFVGWLSADIPELHHVEVPRLAESLDRYLSTVVADTPQEPTGK